MREVLCRIVCANGVTPACWKFPAKRGFSRPQHGVHYTRLHAGSGIPSFWSISPPPPLRPQCPPMRVLQAEGASLNEYTCLDRGPLGFNVNTGAPGVSPSIQGWHGVATRGSACPWVSTCPVAPITPLTTQRNPFNYGSDTAGGGVTAIEEVGPTCYLQPHTMGYDCSTPLPKHTQITISESQRIPRNSPT